MKSAFTTILSICKLMNSSKLAVPSHTLGVTAKHPAPGFGLLNWHRKLFTLNVKITISCDVAMWWSNVCVCVYVCVVWCCSVCMMLFVGECSCSEWATVIVEYVSLWRVSLPQTEPEGCSYRVVSCSLVHIKVILTFHAQWVQSLL